VLNSLKIGELASTYMRLAQIVTRSGKMGEKINMIEIVKPNDAEHIAEREKRIKREKARLKRIIRDVDEERKKTAEPIIENLAFIRIQCEDLRTHILQFGVVEEYQNGQHQWGKKESSEFKVYNQLIKNYVSLNKQFSDLLPKQIAKEISDGFDDFIRNKPT
jgi:hypothetical protein